MKWILILIVLLHCQNALGNAYSKIERDTITSAFDVLQIRQVLHAISQMCGNEEYIAFAPRDELDVMIKKKLHINLVTLEQMTKKREAYQLALNYELRGIECKNINVEEYLSALYDDYDLALFSLGLYEPISTQLASQ